VARSAPNHRGVDAVLASELVGDALERCRAPRDEDQVVAVARDTARQVAPDAGDAPY
jgi:hypothetical protein